MEKLNITVLSKPDELEQIVGQITSVPDVELVVIFVHNSNDGENPRTTFIGKFPEGSRTKGNYSNIENIVVELAPNLTIPQEWEYERPKGTGVWSKESRTVKYLVAFKETGLIIAVAIKPWANMPEIWGKINAVSVALSN